jgi:uncharacterized protein YecE (DUF72 family)
MENLFIGTSGWSYEDWRGKFYPERLSKSEMLEFYAMQFNSLEINTSYYNIPPVKWVENWVNKTQKQVMFTMKAHQSLTHFPDFNEYQRNAHIFKNCLDPLFRCNKLLCVLLQFPQSFHYEINERKYLDLLLKEMSDVPLVIEMRNKQWQNENVYKELKQRKIGWCITDNPKLKDLLETEYIATSDIAYMRFHGRNAEMWYKGDNVSRYDYHYSDEELQEFVKPLLKLLKNTRIVQLFFNNHAKSNATVNAKKLEFLLKQGNGAKASPYGAGGRSQNAPKQ